MLILSYEVLWRKNVIIITILAVIHLSHNIVHGKYRKLFLSLLFVVLCEFKYVNVTISPTKYLIDIGYRLIIIIRSYNKG